jgi:hypothetical protein
LGEDLGEYVLVIPDRNSVTLIPTLHLVLRMSRWIEALTPHTAQEALADGIGAWSVIRGFENLDATRLGNLSEAHTKLAIILPVEVFLTYTKGGGFPNRYVPSKRRWESVSR